MSGLKQKFVITKDGHLKVGRVHFHFDLDKESIGGGYWFFDIERKVVYLYSSSVDFGGCTKNQIDEVMDDIKLRFRGAEVKFEEDETVKILNILCRDMSFERATEIISKNDWVSF